MGRNFDLLDKLKKQVESAGACSLPGCSFDFDVFMPILQRAVIRGFVPLSAAKFVADGLRWGFRCGVDVTRMKGKRIFSNYPTAFAGAAKVSKAILKRVQASKTMCLGVFDRSMKHLVPFDVFCVFPMGAVKKKLEDELRPVDDHTRTLLNACTDLTGLRYSGNVHREVASLFFSMFYMLVKDVSDAFPLVPLHPSLWPFMLFQWFDVEAEQRGEVPGWSLFVHLFAGFGMSGLPGVWKILFQDVVVGMARSERQLTLPMPVFVDDAAVIGSTESEVNLEGAALAAFLLFLGITMKEIKTRWAATLQLYIGLWWNSITRTVELEPARRDLYLQSFDAVQNARVLTLREVQSLAGRMQRAALTFPPGAECVFSSLYEFMRGLILPWQKRRVSRGLRADVEWGASMLRANLGRGYFSYDMFEWVPPAWTDASKSSSYCGGGYVSALGKYFWCVYGTSAARKPIDELEGDMVRAYVEQEGGRHWRRRIVPIYIDNSAFQQSAVKGWSKASRLNDLLKLIFRYSVEFECIFMFYWISTHDNVLADALSRRAGLDAFLHHPRLREFIAAGVKLTPHPSSGCVRHWGKGFSSSTDGDGPGRHRLPLSSTVPYTRASIYSDLPSDVANWVDEIMDNRLGASSHQSIKSALVHWDIVRARYGWARIIATDDLTRGSKLICLGKYFATETELGFSSISNYFWALRSWFKFQRQLDPVYGLAEWDDFMSGMEVLTFVPAEPRKEVPGAWILGAAAGVDVSCFWEVQCMVLMLMLLFTFSRSETPLPGAASGENGLDFSKHLLVQDVKLEIVGGKRTVGFRLKAIKQDPRMQRPAAQGEGDWVWVGDAPGPCSMVMWLQRLFQFYSARRSATEPFFVSRDGSHALLYRQGLRDCRELWSRTPGVSAEMAKTCGLHGLRVAGNNGTRKTKGKSLAKVQGGWASEASQDRYDRQDMAEVVDIPNAIVSLWSAPVPAHDPVFDIQQPESDLLPEPASAAPAPAPPVERAVQVRGASRNVRRGRPPSAACSSGARKRPRSAGAAAVGTEPASVRAGLQTHGPVSRPSPPEPPPSALAQRRVSGADVLSLQRPIRASRLARPSRLPVGAPGGWASALT